MKRFLFAFIAIYATSFVSAQLPGIKIRNSTITILDTLKINVGDTLHLGQGSNPNKNFIYFFDNFNHQAGNNYAGQFVKIKFFKYENNGLGKKFYAAVNADQLYNYGVDLANAIKYGEVIGVNRIKFNQNKTATTTIIQNKISTADELKKYKELLDQGVISQDEFDAQKKKLLEQK